MPHETKLTPHKQKLFDTAQEERERCFEWIKQFVKEGQPRAFTKAELCQAAQQELNVSKNSFNHAWFMVEIELGQDKWCQPIRIKNKTKQ